MSAALLGFIDQGGLNLAWDFTLGTLVPINYSHPPSLALDDLATERRFNAYGSHHPGGSHFALCDGSVRFISESVEMATFRGLGTRAGGEILSEF